MSKASKKKQCPFCKKKIVDVDFKDVALLQRQVTSWSKIKKNRESGACAKHQRSLSKAIKNARYMALLPFTTR